MTKEETDLIITEQNKSTEEILKAVAKVKSDYHELCELKDMRIAELEKKNGELEDRLCNVANNLLDNWCRNKDDYCPHLAKLEEENTELKESNKMLEQGYVWHDYDAGEDSYEDTHEGKWVKRDEVYQLTKAKEIIKKFLLWENAWHNKTESKYELLKQAEQFLNGEVK